MPGYGFGFMSLGMALITLCVVALLALAFWAISREFSREQRSEHTAAAERLGQRYAASEISVAEYEQALKTLRESTRRAFHADAGGEVR